MVSLPRIKLPSPGRVYLPKPHMPRLTANLRMRFVNKGHKITDYMKKWERIFLFRSGASIRTYALTSMKRRKNKEVHSPIFKPPFSHLRKSAFLRPAIQFVVDLVKRSVFVGVLRSVAGFWGQKHEHGGYFGIIQGTGKKAFFPPRPFMEPAFRRWQRFGLPAILKKAGKQVYRT